MKKVLLSAVALLAFGFANAQEEEKGNGGFSKGSMFISGAVSIDSEKTGDAKSSGFEIAPKFGYFVTENIAIGGKLGYESMKADNGFVDTTDRTALTVGAFGRYYMTPASQFSLFGEFGVDYTSWDNKLADVQENEIGVNLGLGLSYFLNNNWAIEATWAGLGYTTNDNGGDGADKTNSFGLGADLRSFGFGVIYKF
ncbi:MAG: porin family protein [Flavobacterium sp.]|uniref:outer membrane beta-barrel protein n=1 Tax=Flavobacterium sp. TaxID=239 RepID=UPI0025C042AC|nr:outer membrane beta-barrel protein [Flavobacterium sp.]MCK6606853.1 porin family protein [Flavobacterium sp.]